MSQPQTSTPMYLATLSTIPAAFSSLLKDYSGISPDNQHDHILQLRDQAYKHHPYPCLGRWRFLELDLSLHPQYKTVLEILSSHLKEPTTSPATFLDLGCCLAQDVRKVILDLHETTGITTTTIAKQVYGADLRPEFIDLGYELFNDESIIPKSQFIAPADVFDTSPTAALAAIDNKISVLNCAAVFHLFNWDEQIKLARRCLHLLNRAGIKGTYGKKMLLLGAQAGNVTASEYPKQSGGSRYHHNNESWEKLWDGVVGSEEWRGVIKGIEVRSELQLPTVESLVRGVDKDAMAKAKEAAGESEEKQRSWIIGKIEDGFRWQVWWVWVEFY